MTETPNPTAEAVLRDLLNAADIVHARGAHTGPQWTGLAARILQARSFLATPSAPQPEPFQAGVDRWLIACFGETIARDKIERNHRLLEEALEAVQAGGCTRSEAHELVDYVFDRPVGDLAQEVGGVMNTLAAFCLAHGLDMMACGDAEMARVWTKVETIRAKQAAKPKFSPLPEHVAPQPDALDARTVEALKAIVADADYWPADRGDCLCTECGAWMPKGHPEMHDHEEGCSKPAEVARRRDWKSRIRNLIATAPQHKDAAGADAWAQNEKRSRLWQQYGGPHLSAAPAAPTQHKDAAGVDARQLAQARDAISNIRQMHLVHADPAEMALRLFDLERLLWGETQLSPDVAPAAQAAGPTRDTPQRVEYDLARASHGKVRARDEGISLFLSGAEFVNPPEFWRSVVRDLNKLLETAPAAQGDAEPVAWGLFRDEEFLETLTGERLAAKREIIARRADLAATYSIRPMGIAAPRPASEDARDAARWRTHIVHLMIAGWSAEKLTNLVNTVDAYIARQAAKEER